MMKTTRLPNDPIPGAGMDAEHRPGVPMELEPPRPAGNAYWVEPAKQAPKPGVLKRANLDELTPVFSDALPPKGLSGLIRRLAYRIPEHRFTHWALLLLGDRIDVFEHRLIRALPFVAVPAALLVGGYYVTRRRSLL